MRSRRCGRKNGSFYERCGQGRTLQALYGIEERVEIGVAISARGEGSLPVGEEARERVLLDGLNFTAKFGQRFAANLA